MKLNGEKVFTWTLVIGFAVFIAICLLAFFGLVVNTITETKEEKCEKFTIAEYMHGVVPFECLTKAEEVRARIK